MRGLGILAAGAVVLALTTSGSVAAESVAVGSDPLLEAELTITPKALPKRQAIPAALDFELRLNPALDGVAHPTKELGLELDRNVSLDFDGYPVCRSNGPALQPLPAPPLSAQCEKAIAGRGSVSFEILFPDTESVAISSPLRLINFGRSGGGWKVLAVAEITVPVPATIVTTIEIRPVRDGRYATKATFALPKIAGGSGALTHLRFRLNKRFLHKGERKSLVRARCPDGKLQAELEAVFADESSAGETLIRPCAPTPR